MKAQFATIEALLSLFAAIVALAFVHSASNGIGARIDSARSSLDASLASYDFNEQLRYDPRLQWCVAQYGAGNTSCFSAYVKYYAQAYGLGYFGIGLGSSFGLPAWAFVNCYPYLGKDGKSEICIGAV